MTAMQEIAAWAVEDGIESLPDEGVQLVKRAFVDTLGVTLLGARLEGPRIIADIECSAGGRPEASIVGMRKKTEVRSAALINGTSAHADLFDDNSAPMIAHPSAPLVSALLPLAQVRGASGRAVLQAYAVGFEIGVKLGRMLNPQLYEQGWHATRVIGILGCTAACCRLLGLGSSKTIAALGIATSLASGIRQNFGTMTMALHAGLTARDAIHAALLAERGFGADPNALEGRYGFFRVFSNQTPALLPLGDPFELVASGIIFKPYPSGAPTHAAVDAALALRARLGGDWSRIAKVLCLVHPWNAMTLREEEPRDMLQAKVSLRYCVAAALRFGELSYAQFAQECLHDPDMRELMRRIEVRTSDDLPDNNEFPAQVEIATVDAEKLVERCEIPPGGSRRPMSEAEVAAKFRSCAALALEPTAADRVLSMVGELETLPTVADLCEILEGGGSDTTARAIAMTFGDMDESSALSPSQKLAGWMTALTYDAIPADVIAHAKLRILDTIGVALAASALEYGKVMGAAVREMSASGPSHVIGSRDAVRPIWAAMANGMLAHALIFDDTHNETIVHPSGPVLSTALAVSEAVDGSGRELLTAFVGGTEITCRLGLAAPNEFHKSGFQPTAIVGPIGSAFVASRLYGLDPTRAVHAAGITGSFASGINESWTDGTWTQLLHPGWAAHSGIAAALLAKNGYTGPRTVVEGRFGLFRSHIQQPQFAFQFERIAEGLGSTWEGRRISFKPYPCAHVIHPFLDALLALYREGLRVDQVKRIICPIAEYMIRVVCEPVQEKKRPLSAAQARTSLQYSLAEALHRGALDAASYGSEALRDPAILNLADRVEFRVDDTAPDSRTFKGWVIVETNDGGRLERIEPSTRGSPDNPLSEGDVIKKFRMNAAMAIRAQDIEVIQAIVASLEQQDSVAQLMRLCAGDS